MTDRAWRDRIRQGVIPAESPGASPEVRRPPVIESRGVLAVGVRAADLPAVAVAPDGYGDG